MTKYRLEDLIEQVKESEYFGNPESETFVTVSGRGRGVSKRNIADGKTPVPFSGYRVKAGQLIYSRIGATDGAFGVVPAELNNAIVSKDFPVFWINEKILRKNYLLYYLCSEHFRSTIGNKSSGATLKRLKEDIFLDAVIEVPSLKGQDEILNALSGAKEIVLFKQQQLHQLDTLVKARFIEMFGVPGSNPKGWSEVKLGEVCDLQNGYAFKSSDYIEKSDVLNCRMSNIRPNGEFDADYHPKYLPNDYWDKCASYRIFDGDVIIAMTDMASDPKILGVPTIVSTNGKKFLLNQRVGKLVFLHDDRMDRIYLMHSLGQKFIRTELAKNAAGSTQINVGKPAILDIDIYEPPKKLQKKFASFVSQVDKSKFAIQKSLGKTQQLFDSLMQEYFG